jgi:hypothetical protein
VAKKFWVVASITLAFLFVTFFLGYAISRVGVYDDSGCINRRDGYWHYWYNAPDGTYWAYTGEIRVDVESQTAYFSAPSSAATQLHCGPFGWVAPEVYQNPMYPDSQLVHLRLVNNTVVEVFYGSG